MVNDRPDTTREDDAMTRYACGEDGAFGQVYDVLSPRLWGFLRRQVRDTCLAEDLLQQTFLHVHRARGRFTHGSEVAPWAFAIARRLVIDAARHRARRPTHELEASEQEQVASTGPSPLEIRAVEPPPAA